MNGVAGNWVEEHRRSGGGVREGISPREAIRLHERLARAVTTREEGVVLAQNFVNFFCNIIHTYI